MNQGPRKRRLAHEINVVPYIDVMLVLLVIFMITAPLLSQGVQVDLPDAAAEALDYEEDEEPIVLSVDARGRLYLNRGEQPDQPLAAEDVVRITRTIVKHQPQVKVIVEGDSRAEYAHVVRGMVLLQEAGVRKIGFATEPPEKR